MINNEYLTQIPPKEGRYVVLDTETTGFGKDAHITEFCVQEILNGKITGKNFRCSMKIFKDIIGKENNLYNKFCKLKECCNYFNITSNKYEYHTARFDAFMTSKYICKLYQKLENEKLIFNNINLIEDIETNKNIIKLNEDNKVTNEIIIKNNEIIKVSKINRKKNKITDPKEIVKNIFKEYEIYEKKFE